MGFMKIYYMPIFPGRYQKYLGSVLREEKCDFSFPEKQESCAWESLRCFWKKSVLKQLDHSRHAQPC